MDDSSTMFDGIKFWVSSKVPSRGMFIDHVKNHGGTVVPLERMADMCILDTVLRKETQSLENGYSYKFIEQSVRNGALEDSEDHRIRVPSTATTVSGRDNQPTKNTRTPFSTADDEFLLSFLRAHSSMKPLGRAVYELMANKNPRHTWHSWQSRFRDNPRFMRDLHQSPQSTQDTPVTPPTESSDDLRQRRAAKVPISHSQASRTVSTPLQRGISEAEVDRPAGSGSRLRATAKDLAAQRRSTSAARNKDANASSDHAYSRGSTRPSPIPQHQTTAHRMPATSVMNQTRPQEQRRSPIPTNVAQSKKVTATPSFIHPPLVRKDSLSIPKRQTTQPPARSRLSYNNDVNKLTIERRQQAPNPANRIGTTEPRAAAAQWNQTSRTQTPAIQKPAEKTPISRTVINHYPQMTPEEADVHFDSTIISKTTQTRPKGIQHQKSWQPTTSIADEDEDEDESIGHSTAAYAEKQTQNSLRLDRGPPSHRISSPASYHRPTQTPKSSAQPRQSSSHNTEKELDGSFLKSGRILSSSRVSPLHSQQIQAAAPIVSTRPPPATTSKVKKVTPIPDGAPDTSADSQVDIALATELWTELLEETTNHNEDDILDGALLLVNAADILAKTDKEFESRWEFFCAVATWRLESEWLSLWNVCLPFYQQHRTHFHQLYRYRAHGEGPPPLPAQLLESPELGSARISYPLLPSPTPAIAAPDFDLGSRMDVDEPSTTRTWNIRQDSPELPTHEHRRSSPQSSSPPDRGTKRKRKSAHFSSDGPRPRKRKALSEIPESPQSPQEIRRSRIAQRQPLGVLEYGSTANNLDALQETQNEQDHERDIVYPTLPPSRTFNAIPPRAESSPTTKQKRAEEVAIEQQIRFDEQYTSQQYRSQKEELINEGKSSPEPESSNSLIAKPVSSARRQGRPSTPPPPPQIHEKEETLFVSDYSASSDEESELKRIHADDAADVQASTGPFHEADTVEDRLIHDDFSSERYSSPLIPDSSHVVKNATRTVVLEPACVPSTRAEIGKEFSGKKINQHMADRQVPFIKTEPKTPERETESNSDSDVPDDVDQSETVAAWRARHLADGVNEEALSIVLNATNMQTKLASQALPYFLKNKRLPPDEKGVWTSKDDEALFRNKKSEQRKLGEKHGKGSPLKQRKEFLEKLWGR